MKNWKPRRGDLFIVHRAPGFSFFRRRTPEGFKLVAPGWSAGFRGALLPGVTVPKKYISPSSLPSFPFVKSVKPTSGPLLCCSVPLRSLLLKKSVPIRSHPWLKIPLRISNFVILSSFGLRHSSFHLPLLRSLLLKQFVLFSSHSWLNSPFPFLRLDPFRAFRAFRGSALPPKNWTQMLGFERTKL
jgi:hypothetical protein